MKDEANRPSAFSLQPSAFSLFMIHPTAIISSRAELGANVSVGPYSIIGDQVVIHDQVEIASHVVIAGPCEIRIKAIFRTRHIIIWNIAISFITL